MFSLLPPVHFCNISIMYALQRFDDAWLASRRALLLLTVVAGPAHPEIASLHMTMSNIAIEMRDAGQMIQHASEAQRIRAAACAAQTFISTPLTSTSLTSTPLSPLKHNVPPPP